MRALTAAEMDKPSLSQSKAREAQQNWRAQGPSGKVEQEKDQHHALSLSLSISLPPVQ